MEVRLAGDMQAACNYRLPMNIWPAVLGQDNISSLQQKMRKKKDDYWLNLSEFAFQIDAVYLSQSFAYS